MSSSIMCCSLFFCLTCSTLLFALPAEWVIVANGGSFSEPQFLRVCPGKQIMVLDGAANLLKQVPVRPHVILGDFDSIEDKEYWGIEKTFDQIEDQAKSYKGNFGILVVPAKDQDYTDLEKGIIYCDRQGALSILVINATGGRMDHTLGNLGLMRKYYRASRPLSILTERERLEYIKDGSTVIRGAVGDQCAILGYPEAFMTTTGLVYNGDCYPLKMGIQESVCNKLAEPSATVHIEGEAIVIHPLH
jgi:thiamine pyrophosphokinase